MPGSQFNDTGFSEYYDAQSFSQDWYLPLFDDSKWKNAVPCISERHVLFDTKLP
jgi:hypothetical protein